MTYLYQKILKARKTFHPSTLKKKKKAKNGNYKHCTRMPQQQIQASLFLSLISLCLTFFICRMGIIVVPFS